MAIDCEMVQVVGGKQVLAHICAVDWNEAVLINTYVAPGARVKDYLTRYSGLRAGDLDGAPIFDSVRAQVAALLEGSILVGHAPSNDLRALQLKHPAELTRDTAALDWGERERGAPACGSSAWRLTRTLPRTLTRTLTRGACLRLKCVAMIQSISHSRYSLG